MPAVTRKGDSETGVCDLGLPDCPHTRGGTNNSTSPNVFVNNLGAHRLGDIWDRHRRKRAHKGVLVAGSSTVYVNNKQLGRISDPINCGSFVATGSPNVFAGD